MPYGPDLPARGRGRSARRSARWLEENLPDGWFDEGFELTGEERKAFNEEWPDKLYEGGWICASWPEEYGGKGLSMMETVVLNEEFARAGAPDAGRLLRRHPRRAHDPAVGDRGAEAGVPAQDPQRARSRGARASPSPTPAPTWPASRPRPCSTATSGSSTARRSGPPRRSTPTTSSCWPAPTPTPPSTRASPTCSCPMQQPGVEVRPIVQLDGSAEFNEVFFTDARCPKDNVVGGVNNGWKVAMTTLGFERGTSATTGHRRFEKELDQIIEIARANGAHRRPDRPPAPRRGLDARCRSCGSTACARSRRCCTARKDPGVAALGATQQDVLVGVPPRRRWSWPWTSSGMDGQILTGTDDDAGVRARLRRAAGARATTRSSALQAAFFFSRSETIWGGTAEIQRNIVGERVLGLPKEPWSQEPDGPTGPGPAWRRPGSAAWRPRRADGGVDLVPFVFALAGERPDRVGRRPQAQAPPAPPAARQHPAPTPR